MSAVRPPQINFSPPAQIIQAPDDCAVSKIAIHAIRALGAILAVASILFLSPTS